jgi:polyisoprenoid-binding protein YceI
MTGEMGNQLRGLAAALTGLLALAEVSAAGPSPQPVPPAGRYEIRAADSYVGYRILKWGMVPVRGRFAQVGGVIAVDPGAPERSRAEVRVPLAGLESGDPDRTATLLSDDFFDARRHPEMHFASERIVRGPQGDWLASGRLTIAGVTRTVTVPVELAATPGDPALALFTTRFTIDRRDYGVLGSRWSGGRAILEPTVEVELALTARRAADTR